MRHGTMRHDSTSCRAMSALRAAAVVQARYIGLHLCRAGLTDVCLPCQHGERTFAGDDVRCPEKRREQRVLRCGVGELLEATSCDDLGRGGRSWLRRQRRGEEGAGGGDGRGRGGAGDDNIVGERRRELAVATSGGGIGASEGRAEWELGRLVRDGDIRVLYGPTGPSGSC